MTNQNGEPINTDLMMDIMYSLINAIRLSLPREIKFLFHLFEVLCEKRTIKKSNVINMFFFQRFLITKCSLDNFHEVRSWLFYFSEKFDEVSVGLKILN